MRTPVPKLIRRPSRSTPSVLLALLLLTAGGLGAWLTGHRIVTGTWPDRTVTTLDAIGSATLGSVAVLVAAGIDPRGPVAGAARARRAPPRHRPRPDRGEAP